MKKLTLFLASIVFASASFAQFERIEVEQVPNSGKVAGKTYRVYAVMKNQGDIIDAVFGDERHPLEVTSTKPFFQHKQGGMLSNDVQRFDVQNDPSLSFDSWFTIGMTDNYNNYLSPFLMDSTEIRTFESGGSYRTSTGAWFVTPDRKQGQADKNGRILLIQLTTAGKVTGTINIHGREREVKDANGDVIEGGFIIEERGIKFTCG
jgi:hypothetical protein